MTYQYYVVFVCDGNFGYMTVTIDEKISGDNYKELYEHLIKKVGDNVIILNWILLNQQEG